MKVLALLLFVVIFILLSCKRLQSKEKTSNQTTNSIPHDELNKVDASKIVHRLSGSLFMKIDTLRFDSFMLQIKTICQDDSIIPEEAHIYNPIVIKQELSFHRNNIETNRLEWPSRKLLQKDHAGKMKLILQNVIFYVAVIKLSNYTYGYYLESYAGAGCNSPLYCPEFEALIDLNGTIVSIFYHNSKENYLKEGNMGLLREISKNINTRKLKEMSFFPCRP
jgi:hypothetical protein